MFRTGFMSDLMSLCSELLLPQIGVPVPGVFFADMMGRLNSYSVSRDN